MDKKTEDFAEKAKAKIEKKEAKAKKAQTKRLDDVLEEVDIIRKIYVEELDCYLEYKKLDIDGFVEAQKIKDRAALSRDMLFRMLKAADPQVTRAKVGKIPFDLATKIVTRMTETTFLQKT